MDDGSSKGSSSSFPSFVENQNKEVANDDSGNDIFSTTVLHTGDHQEEFINELQLENQLIRSGQSDTKNKNINKKISGSSSNGNSNDFELEYGTMVVNDEVENTINDKHEQLLDGLKNAEGEGDEIIIINDEDDLVVEDVEDNNYEKGHQNNNNNNSNTNSNSTTTTNPSSVSSSYPSSYATTPVSERKTTNNNNSTSDDLDFPSSNMIMALLKQSQDRQQLEIKLERQQQIQQNQSNSPSPSNPNSKANSTNPSRSNSSPSVVSLLLERSNSNSKLLVPQPPPIISSKTISTTINNNNNNNTLQLFNPDFLKESLTTLETKLSAQMNESMAQFKQEIVNDTKSVLKQELESYQVCIHLFLATPYRIDKYTDQFIFPHF